MPDREHEILIPANTVIGRDKWELTLGQVTVFLGANGTGKSRLMSDMMSVASQFAGDAPVVYVEGGRAITPPDTLALTRNNFQQFGTLQLAQNTHSGQLQRKLTERVQAALLLLDRMGQEGKIKHSDVASSWNQNGRPGDFPLPEEAPLAMLFALFHRLFPEITLSIDADSKVLNCVRGGGQYQPSNLSDGEKQVLSLLADIALLAQPNSVVLVDEPELNLHPALACSLWDLIESELPDAYFVYATHCLSFALRRNVDRVIVLNRGGELPLELPNLAEMPKDELAQFLGAIPGILVADEAIAVEGRDDSFDRVFYGWVAGDRSVAIVPLGSCTAVKAAANHTGIWETLAPGTKIQGVIDRDFRSEGELGALSGDACRILDYHEVESYLCQPNIIVAIAHKLGIVDSPPSVDDVLRVICAHCENDVLRVAGQRTAGCVTLRLDQSIPRSAWPRVSDQRDVEELLKQAAEEARDKASELLDDGRVVAVFQAELSLCQKAVDEKAVDSLLRLFPAKDLCVKLARKAGCRDANMLVLAVTKHLAVEDYPEIVKLQDGLWPGG